MLDVFMQLAELSNKIGNSCSVGFEYRRWENLLPVLRIRVDWPDDFHLIRDFTERQLTTAGAEFFKYVVAEIRHTYDEKLKSLR